MRESTEIITNCNTYRGIPVFVRVSEDVLERLREALRLRKVKPPQFAEVCGRKRNWANKLLKYGHGRWEQDQRRRAARWLHAPEDYFDEGVTYPVPNDVIPIPSSPEEDALMNEPSDVPAAIAAMVRRVGPITQERMLKAVASIYAEARESVASDPLEPALSPAAGGVRSEPRKAATW